jgi:16S rRNA (adenine1518-N6/adenine1519-N6)-dimethyltransferase
MLRSSLKSLHERPEELLAAAELPPTARAEEIDVPGFCRLARSYAALRSPGTEAAAEVNDGCGTGRRTR